MKRTFKYRLYPTKRQIEKLEWTLDMCRILYNSCLMDRRSCYEQTGKGLSRIRQQEILKSDKQRVKSLSEIHSQVLQDVLFRVERAFQGFFRRLKEQNDKAGYPRVKGKNRYNSFTYPQSGFEIVNNRLNLSKTGHIKIKLHRSIQGTIKTCTIKREIDRWYACFSVELENQEKKSVEFTTGIDAGFRKVVTLSNGEAVENPSFYRKTLSKLKIVQKSLSRKVKGSNNRKKQRVVLAKLHRTIANKRKDFLHKLSRKLVNTYDLIAIEKLNLNQMVHGNKYISKPLYDTGWGCLKDMLVYKAEEAGKRVVEVDPSGTSEKCSVCGASVPKSPSKRRHRCECGADMDRDHNAAINILLKSTAGTAGSLSLHVVSRDNAWGEAVHQCPSLNQEASSVRAR